MIVVHLSNGYLFEYIYNSHKMKPWMTGIYLFGFSFFRFYKIY